MSHRLRGGAARGLRRVERPFTVLCWEREETRLLARSLPPTACNKRRNAAGDFSCRWQRARSDVEPPSAILGRRANISEGSWLWRETGCVQLRRRGFGAVYTSRCFRICVWQAYGATNVVEFATTRLCRRMVLPPRPDRLFVYFAGFLADRLRRH